MEQQNITVTELTNIIRTLLEGSLDVIRVVGEISNYKYHSSGHRYFTLKDEYSQISCTMWRTYRPLFEMKDGMKVILEGKLTVYPPQGKYQIECTKIWQAGLGDLYIAFEEMKQKLLEKGYFAPEIKKSLPSMPLNIGVSTSPTGAAIKDIISTIKRRLPLCNIYFRPTLVQGDAAAQDIAKAIAELHNTPAEVIIIGRGGGSIEDLWAYNTEIVADAIYCSDKPIVSAVGHETDFTIADFVADIRAATPTAAAELVTSDTQQQIEDYINKSEENLKKIMFNTLDQYKLLLKQYKTDFFVRRITDKIRTNIQLVDECEDAMKSDFNKIIQSQKLKVSSLMQQCSALEPMAPLRKGFALLKHNNKVIDNSSSLKPNTYIEIQRLNENAVVQVKKIIEQDSQLF